MLININKFLLVFIRGIKNRKFLFSDELLGQNTSEDVLKMHKEITYFVKSLDRTLKGLSTENMKKIEEELAE